MNISIIVILFVVISIMLSHVKVKEHFNIGSRLTSRLNNAIASKKTEIKESDPELYSQIVETVQDAVDETISNSLFVNTDENPGLGSSKYVIDHEKTKSEEESHFHNEKREQKNPYNWKSDDDYWRMNANNLKMNDHSEFEKEVVINGNDLIFNKSTYFNNDIYLNGNSLRFNTLDDTILNEEVYKSNMLYVNELNKVFSDEVYSLEQDNVEELKRVGLYKILPEKKQCNYFDKEKDYDACKEKIWRALRKKDLSPDPVCNCCCSPDTDVSTCIVQLIKSNGLEPTILQLRVKDEIIYNIVSTQNNDYIWQIGLHKTDNIKTCKLMFFNKQKKRNEDNSGLIKIIFQDEFNSIMEFPNNIGEIKAIKLIIE